jgi:predicted nucleic acid-binding protein
VTPSTLLVDAGVWVAASTPAEPRHAESLAVTESALRLAALDLTLLEVANVIGVKHAEPLRARRVCDLMGERCDDRVVRIDGDLLEHCLDVATEHGLTAYDASYVAVAQRNGWTLVSTDIRDLVSKGLAVTPDATV